VAGLIDVESNAPNAFAKHDEDFLAGCAALIASLF
jgi:putative methionine-R-sulfoxide reductase with GAF domain